MLIGQERMQPMELSCSPVRDSLPDECLLLSLLYEGPSSRPSMGSCWADEVLDNRDSCF